MQKQLKLPQFVPVDRIEESKLRFEEENPYNIERLNELRAIMVAENNDSSAHNSSSSLPNGLVSLNGIVLKQVGHEHAETESYIQL